MRRHGRRSPAQPDGDIQSAHRRGISGPAPISAVGTAGARRRRPRPELRLESPARLKAAVVAGIPGGAPGGREFGAACAWGRHRPRAAASPSWSRLEPPGAGVAAAGRHRQRLSASPWWAVDRPFLSAAAPPTARKTPNPLRIGNLYRLITNSLLPFYSARLGSAAGKTFLRLGGADAGKESFLGSVPATEKSAPGPLRIEVTLGTERPVRAPAQIVARREGGPNIGALPSAARSKYLSWITKLKPLKDSQTDFSSSAG